MGTRLKEIIFDKQEDRIYEDERAKALTHYVMAERCIQVQMKHIHEEYGAGDYSTLSFILEGGFKGFHNMEPSELIKEYEGYEDRWYELYEDEELPLSVYEDDPINKIEKVI